MTPLFAKLIGEGGHAVFEIGVPSFRVAGGIIIFGIGLSILNTSTPAAGAYPPATSSRSERRSAAIVPLAIPPTLGPGSIVTSIDFAHQLYKRA